MVDPPPPHLPTWIGVISTAVASLGALVMPFSDQGGWKFWVGIVGTPVALVVVGIGSEGYPQNLRFAFSGAIIICVMIGMITIAYQSIAKIVKMSKQKRKIT